MATETNQPNVLFVLTDQQRWDTAGCYGSPMDLTPNLDAMAERGTRLDQCVSANPVCGPQRASLQTGQYPTEVGIHTNLMSGDADSPIEDATTLADAFNEAGYQTGYIGKWHLANTRLEPVPERLRGGYEDHWLAADAFEHTSHAYEGTLFDSNCEPVKFEDRYRVDFLTDCAERFLTEERDENDPFFLFLSYLEPHHQNDRDTYDAPEGYAERYANPWVPPDLEGRPGDWFEELPDYYGCIRRLDENLGRLLDLLERDGIADETIVVFTADHGCHFKTRNAEYKRSCHESSIRVPAVLRGPGFDHGSTVDEVVSLLDLPATLLDAADIEPPESFQSESILEITEENETDHAFIQISEMSVERALRTDRWTYSVYDPDADPIDDPASDEYVERYLYDLHADPHQRVNLVGRPDYRGIADELRERLCACIAKYEDRTAEIHRAEYHA